MFVMLIFSISVSLVLYICILEVKKDFIILIRVGVPLLRPDANILILVIIPSGELLQKAVRRPIYILPLGEDPRN